MIISRTPLRISLGGGGTDLPWLARQVEVSSMADIPANTGLGSSGSFTVGVLKALYAFRRRVVSNLELAEQACHIEIDRLGEPIGKQDKYIAALGGVTAQRQRFAGLTTAQIDAWINAGLDSGASGGSWSVRGGPTRK